MPDFGFDDWMDAQLRHVPVPRDLHARLSANRPEPHPSDDQIDAALRNVPLPPHLARHLRRIPWQHPLASPWRIGALAASVLVVIGAVSYFTLGDHGGGAPQAVVAAQSPATKSANP
ncbi:MAG TPA: hypothetical protein VFW87_23630, partial [Pirellulales bacterium]|nr:hypothetical protein [Pirellulales bacterium]